MCSLNLLRVNLMLVSCSKPMFQIIKIIKNNNHSIWKKFPLGLFEERGHLEESHRAHIFVKCSDFGTRRRTQAVYLENCCSWVRLRKIDCEVRNVWSHDIASQAKPQSPAPPMHWQSERSPYSMQNPLNIVICVLWHLCANLSRQTSSCIKLKHEQED